MTRLAHALALLVAGCAVDASGLTAPSAQDAPGTEAAPSAALSTVLASYGASGLAQGPRVRWVQGRPECGGIGWTEAGRCVRGMFQDDAPGVIVVATWPGADIAQTSFAHEMRHWLLLITTGKPSADHGGDFYARVETANEALWRAE